ncbi:MAG: roadblock/LC7 domain-containing protein [Vulcanisaeta sp.]|nr:roadblock/LC7 domain-containing protein [Vulcanisaeta sp.]
MFILLLELNTDVAEESVKKLNNLINNFLSSAEYITGIYVASLDGLLITYASKKDIDPDKVAAMIASISAVGDGVSRELLSDPSTHVIVQSRSGYVIIRREGDLVFGVLVQGADDSTMGLVMLEFEKLLESVRNIK